MGAYANNFNSTQRDRPHSGPCSSKPPFPEVDALRHTVRRSRRAGGQKEKDERARRAIYKTVA